MERSSKNAQKYTTWELKFSFSIKNLVMTEKNPENQTEVGVLIERN